MANSTAIKTIDDCTDMQKKFIYAITSDEIREIKDLRKRWRWAADQAGYEKNTPISTILRPIQHLLKDVAQLILDRASIEASWQLAGAAGGGEIDAQIKDRLAASRDILDRSVPKKDSDAGKKNTQPVAVIVLPTKGEDVKVIEGQAKEVYEEISSQAAGET